MSPPRTVLVTGSNRGIGFAFVKQLAESGATVFACCRSPSQSDPLQQLSTSITNGKTFSSIMRAQAPLDKRFISRKAQVLNVSSLLGSLSWTPEPPFTMCSAYRASKAAMNMITREYANHLKDEGFIFLSVCPGWVQTDMGDLFGRSPNTPEMSVQCVLNIIDTATSEDNGKYKNFRNQIVDF
ncbi:hypothetical protein PROFUN_02701 [Planoprotostelium fungivorum]|uniref:Uncharacterized protein n=1 Tax=Planoprotostelium fungivorum TaxID=1890364 RepID=A0A2P6NVG9_9EUKA|nr:hypothetical protein PROFUN_02701 [Planoprotostelium fungivorum]